MKNVLIILACSFASVVAFGQQRSTINTQKTFKAIYLWKFAESTAWPEGAESDVFRIGVLEDKELFDLLKKQAETKEIHNLPVQVVLLKDLKSAKSYHLLYSKREDGYTAKKLFSAIGDSPVLLLTEGNGNTTMMNLSSDGKGIDTQFNEENFSGQGFNSK